MLRTEQNDFLRLSIRVCVCVHLFFLRLNFHIFIVDGLTTGSETHDTAQRVRNISKIYISSASPFSNVKRALSWCLRFVCFSIVHHRQRLKNIVCRVFWATFHAINVLVGVELCTSQMGFVLTGQSDDARRKRLWLLDIIHCHWKACIRKSYFFAQAFFGKSNENVEIHFIPKMCRAHSRLALQWNKTISNFGWVFAQFVTLLLDRTKKKIGKKLYYKFNNLNWPGYKFCNELPRLK